MRGFETTTGLVIQQGIKQVSSVQKHGLGTRVQLADGRVFYYAKSNASTALVAGNFQQPGGVTTPAQFLTLAVPAAVVRGAKELTITNGTEAFDADEFVGGYLIIDTTPGDGHIYKIRNHPAGTNGASCAFDLHDPVQVALTTSSKVTIVPNPYYGVKITGAVTDEVVGVATIPVAVSSYCWLQTWGICAVKGGTATVAGQVLANSTAGNTAPFAALANTGVAYTSQPVGYSFTQPVASTLFYPVFLTIAG